MPRWGKVITLIRGFPRDWNFTKVRAPRSRFRPIYGRARIAQKAARKNPAVRIIAPSRVGTAVCTGFFLRFYFPSIFVNGRRVKDDCGDFG